MKGTILKPDYYGHKERISIFVRACCQGPETFVSTLTAAQYTDTMLKSVEGFPKRPRPNADKWATEGLFEYVRCRYSIKPGRYQCIFGFTNIDFAKRFIEEFREEDKMSIYKCYCNPSKPFFIADMSLFTKANEIISKGQVNLKVPLRNQFSKLITLAERYWQDNNNKEFPELLIGDDVEIIEKVC